MIKDNVLFGLEKEISDLRQIARIEPPSPGHLVMV